MRIALALALSATLVLGACGDDSDSGGGADAAEEYADTSPEQVVEDILAAMNDLESVRLSGQMVEDGDTLDIDVAISKSGECEGTVGMEGSGSFELMQVDGVSYFKPDEEFWKAQAGSAGEQLMEMAGDKWVMNSEDPDGFGELCDLDNFIEGLEDGPEESKIEGTGDVDGTAAVKLAFKSDDGNEGIAYVAAEEPHRILRLDVENEGQVDFTDFDEEVSVEKPAEDETFDLGSLGG